MTTLMGAYLGSSKQALDRGCPASAKRAFISAIAPDRLHVVLSTRDKVYAAWRKARHFASSSSIKRARCAPSGRPRMARSSCA